MNYVKQHYDLPFLEKGMKVEVAGKSGKIIREKNGYLEIHFDNASKAPAHPTWEIVYYDQAGEIIKDFRKKKIDGKSIVLKKEDLVDLHSGKTNIQIEPNFILTSIVENNWDADDNLIAVTCDFIVLNKSGTAYIIVENIEEDNPRYGSLESDHHIHEYFKTRLNDLAVWQLLVPVLKEYKSKWEENLKLPF